MPNEGRIVLLTHGVSGTSSEVILDSARVVAVPGTVQRAVPGTVKSKRYRGDFTTYPAAPGHVERPDTRFAYRWGGMTSGLKFQALWALFAPFALVNVAGWMLPGPADRMPWCIDLLRAVFRLIGLALTAILVAQATFIVTDVLALQCRQLRGGEGSTCWTWLSADWQWGMSDGLWRASAVFACLTVLFVGGGFVALWHDNDDDLRKKFTDDAKESLDEAYTRQFAMTEFGEKSRTASADTPGIASDDFVLPQDARATLLLTTHAIVGILTAAIMLGGGSQARWFVLVPSFVIIAVAVVVTALCNDPRASGDDNTFGGPASRFASARRMWWLFVSWRAILWLAVVFVILGLVAFLVLPGRLDDAPVNADLVDGDDRVVAVLFGVVAMLVAIALVFTVVTVVDSPRVKGPTRPWLLGLHAPLVAALGVLLGVGAGVALTRLVIGAVASTPDPGDRSASLFDKVSAWLDQLFGAGTLSDTSVRLPPIYAATTWMWGMTALVCVAGTLVILLPYVLSRGRWRVGPASALQTTAPVSVKLRWIVAAGKFAIPGAVGFFAVTAMITGFIAWKNPSLVASWEPIQTLGTVALVAIAAFLLRAVFNAFQNPRKDGRSLGVLWDLASFWPRECHPLVPPAYAPRAIRDLTAFIDDKCDRDKTLVLAGHSQGSLIMYALAHRLCAQDRDQDRRISLLTYGSQLGWAYGRAFPSVLDHQAHERLRTRLDHRWINMVRFTDFIGDGVVAHVGRGGLAAYMPGTVVGDPVPENTDTDPRYPLRGPDGRLLEVWLPDPSPGDFPATATHQHSAYTSDISWGDWVSALSGEESGGGRPTQ